MEETTAPAPAPAPAPAHSTAKRVVVVLLFALFALSLAAAVFLVRSGEDLSRFHTSMPLLGKASGRGDAIGWLTLRGAIYDSSDGRPWAVSSLDLWAKRLEEFAEKTEVKAIVIEINSPGGSVGAVQELHGQILKLRRETRKPVIALMGDVAASGGYYLAAACDRIVAHPGTITGSIGVIFQVGNFEDLLKKVGVRMDPIKSGPLKDIGSPTRTMTAQERGILQALIDDAYGQFLKAVSDGRKRPVSEIRPLADGRIYTGAQAKELGLVDVVGTSEDAIRIAKELGKMTGKPKILRRREDAFDLFLSVFDSMTRGLDPRVEALLAPVFRGPGLEYRWSGG